MIHPTSSGPIAVKGFGHMESPATQADRIAEHPLCCRVARMLRITAILQLPVLVRALVTGLQVVETHPHLMKQRLAMAARGLSDVNMYRIFTLLVAILLQTFITPPKNIITA